MAQRARGEQEEFAFGHEHDGPQTCVAPVDTVSREELDQVWKAISRLAASIMWHKGRRTELKRRRLSPRSLPTTMVNSEW